MGMLDGMLGNANEADIKEVEKELSAVLIESEKIDKAFKLIRDYFVFTNKRLILVDKQGLTGKKVEFHSIPYKEIGHFSVESAGHFDLDSEMKIWIKGHPQAIVKQFKKNTNIDAVQQTLAFYVLK